MTTCLAFVNTILIATEDFEERVRLRNEFSGEKKGLVPRERDLLHYFCVRVFFGWNSLILFSEVSLVQNREITDVPYSPRNSKSANQIIWVLDNCHNTPFNFQICN